MSISERQNQLTLAQFSIRVPVASAAYPPSYLNISYKCLSANSYQPFYVKFMRIDDRPPTTEEVGRSPAMAALVLLSAILCICSPVLADELNYSSIADSTGLMSTSDQGHQEAVIASTEPQALESAVLVLEKPKTTSLIPYTERGFPESVEAAVAWWMNPKFYTNTTEYRNYLRASPEDQGRKYSSETRIFFDFITDNLDIALNESELNETLILYRGISEGLADKILNNSEYIEPAFASTAYDVTVSLDIFGPRSANGYQNVLVLQRRSGRHALYINDDEREVLMPRGLEWDAIKAISVDNLTVEADFPLYSSGQNTGQFDKVRLIYLRERNG
ncbi:Uncharacterised protein [uncultured archaeon]|nr:Uncharacterised protein [uncultured archaeon]